MTKKLTPKQRKFVQEYQKDLNATQACIRAGYSKKNADKIGPELLGHSRVSAEIAKRQDKLAKKAEVTQEEIIRNLKTIASADMRDVADWRAEDIEAFDADGEPLNLRGYNHVTVKDSDKISDEAAYALQEISATQHGPKIKLHDKIKANELLGKYLGLFKDEQKAPSTLVLNHNNIMVILKGEGER